MGVWISACQRRRAIILTVVIEASLVVVILFFLKADLCLCYQASCCPQLPLLLLCATSLQSFWLYIFDGFSPECWFLEIKGVTGRQVKGLSCNTMGFSVLLDCLVNHLWRIHPAKKSHQFCNQSVFGVE